MGGTKGKIWLVLAVTAVAAAFGGAAYGSATPVGPLPKGPVVVVKLHVGKSYIVKLRKPAAKGHVWRIARAFDSKIVTETHEGETPILIVVTFKAHHAGTTNVVFAETRGETRHAYAARTYRFVVA
ncbi:MAG: hypothetical protein F2663_02580 [Actinobacteria bacterium]|uniref:Unannotated protein n=1 Tax=freshwater metagenome TaxID=449393 RepID=A0A6J6NNY8_9ZZZZ|nr:hypothetical protein [Actinomycetota bacterium]